ncbi:DSBA-like thioredoxin domain-containing protein [Nemania abortiva]|nr:DSBA-like thioredoxin domain-containing protein [Nemania abortiva]
MTVIEIQIVSDIVCAWCYISKRTLDQAINLYRKTYPGGKRDEFKLIWMPYYLNYNPSLRSVEKRELTKTNPKTKDLTPEQREKLTQRMNRAGRAAGIAFGWGGKIGPNPGSRDAHRLIWWSSLPVYATGSGGGDDSDSNLAREKRGALVEGLFEAYHCLELDISDRVVLRDVAVRAGFDAAEVQTYLDSEADADAVDTEAAKSKNIACSGVPTLIVQGEQLDGAQDIEDLMKVFVKVKEREQSDVY